jgi:hypothetical protein
VDRRDKEQLAVGLGCIAYVVLVAIPAVLLMGIWSPYAGYVPIATIVMCFALAGFFALGRKR